MFTEAVVKLTAVCNLNCSYCYMFNLTDTTYKRVPRQMTLDTALQCLEKIERYMDKWQVPVFTISLHGGEPTLWPQSHLAAFLCAISRSQETGHRVQLCLQTNAYRMLSPELLPLLDQVGATVGISIDGPPEINDRSRVTHNGGGSYSRVMANVIRIFELGYGHRVGGFLTAIRGGIAPELYLDWVESLPVKKVDLIWPIEFNYDNPPWLFHGSSTSYAMHPQFGAWLADLFRAWWKRDNPSLVIRLFYSILQMKLGGTLGHTDDLVNDSIKQFVVNTDGLIEYPDYLRNASDGSCRTRFSILEHELTDFIDDPVFARLLTLGTVTPPECASCPHLSICGGGFLPGRTSRDKLLPDRKSILCPDHFFFLSAIDEVLAPHLPLVAGKAHQ